MDVAAWLRELSLARYAQAFQDNDVDGQTLRLLTERDLADIGVKSIGHRRRLMSAIGELDNEPQQEADLRAAPPAEGRLQSQAEHRQISVLYCDMVGSTALSERLDPEDCREVIRSFHATCTRTVAEHDGFEANFIGDCVVAYFGWPRAHEDDAERSVRAAIALVEAVAQMNARSDGAAVAVRVTVATSLVVVGDLVREGPAQEQSALGEAPYLAAQLQTVASPGRVVIDDATRRLLASSYAVQSLGSHVFPRMAEAVQAWWVVSERATDSRFDARRGQDMTPMVGRDQELALLLERWRLAQGGEGQAVLLEGEAGIGKSRIARALMDGCAGQPHERVRWQCSPYHTGSPLWPVIRRLGGEAGLGGQDSAEQMTPQMLRERTLELLVEQLFGLAEQRPLLLVVEDAHWIDPTTLELLGRCLEKIEHARVLIVVTSRPDNQPALAAHPGVTRLSLNRLSRANAEAIVARLGGGSLQAHTLATIVAQTDGVPLFVEELTKAVLETGEASIPASLHGSLMARLDRVPEVKEVAQIAACIGREFDLALVQALAERPAEVPAALDKLVAAELVFRKSSEDNPRFVFKHALVQEAARESLLRDRRRAIHAGILEVLESRKDTPDEILAHHAESALQTDKAIDHWSRAGHAALAKSAYVEAAAFLDCAIALIRSQRDGIDRWSQEVELQLQLGRAHIALHGFGVDATKKAFARAHELLEANRGDAGQRLRAYFGLWAWHVTRAELGDALQLAREVLAAGEADGTPEALLFGHRTMAISHMFLGEFAKARDHFEPATWLPDAAKPGGGIAQSGMEPAALAWLLCLQGFAEQGKELDRRAHEIVAARSQVSAKAQMHLMCAMRAACMRDGMAVAADAEPLAELAAKHRLSMYRDYADALLGWRTVATTAPDEQATLSYQRSLGRLVAGGAQVWVPFFMAQLATSLADCGHHQEALHTIARALDECEVNREGWCDAELWRVRGELAGRGPQPDPAEAERCFERASGIARARGAKLWELRAAVSLTRLWAGQGNHAKARALLAPISDWFIEGFDAADLVEARGLLSELDSTRSARTT